MRNLSIIVMSLVFSMGINAADTSLDPSSLKLKVYRLAVSTSPLCTDLTVIIDESDPSYMDVLSNPSFGDGQIANGTYPCVAIEFSDNIKYTPSETSDSGNCINGTESTLDVCSGGTGETLDGGTVNCTGGEDKVTMFLSTGASASSSSDGFKKPTSVGDTSNGFNLGSALVVSGTTTGTFVVNGTDKIEDDGSICEMNPPSFSFK